LRVRRIDAMRRGLITRDEYQAAVLKGADPKEIIEVEDRPVKRAAKSRAASSEGGVHRAGRSVRVETGMVVETVPASD